MVQMTDTHESAAIRLAQRARWRDKVFLVVRTAIGAALLVYVLRVGGAWTSLTSLFGLFWLVAVLNLVPIAGAAVESVRLGVLFGAHSLPVGFWTGFRIVAVGALFNLWIPGGTGGDVMKLYYLTANHRGRGWEVATILLVDRVVALSAMLLLVLLLVLFQLDALAALSAVRGVAVASATLLALIFAGVALVWSTTVRGSAIYRRVVTLPLGSRLARVADAAFAFRAQPGALVRAGVVSLVGHLMLAGTLAISGAVLLPAVPPLLTCTLALIGLIASAIPLTPGGLGVGEAAAEALFRAVGTPGGAALVTAWRGGMVGISIIGGILYALDLRVTRPARATEPRTSPSAMTD
jgi:uncharacterized protein (TIRG00374 family)